MATRQYDLSFTCLTSECKPIFRCARSFSTLWVQVVLWRCCGLSIRPWFPYCRQKSSPTIILWGKLRQCDRINITGLNEWCRQTKKIIVLESHLLVQIAVPFKFSAFSSTMLYSCVWEKGTVKIVLIFFKFFSFYIIYNLKLAFNWHHRLMQYQIIIRTLWKFLQGCQYLAYF